MNADAIDKILADFRAWLTEAAEMPAAEPAPALEVASVVEGFTALRHEVNLQTRASRAQLEQNAQALTALQTALESLKQQDDQPDEALRPLLMTLIEAHDALSLAQREVQRLLDKTPAASRSADSAQPSPPVIKLRLPYWASWFGLDASIDAQLAPLYAWAKARQQPSPADDSADRFRHMLDALLVGYAMSIQRLERAFAQHGLEPIPCAGRPFDPETMEVAEVVRDEARASTEVIDQVRPGYRWHGKLFRCAQVRVARPIQ